jgi:hypothetical protein
MGRNIAIVSWTIMVLVAVIILTAPVTATVTGEGLARPTDGAYCEMLPSWKPDGGYGLIVGYDVQVLNTDTPSRYSIVPTDINVTFGRLNVRSEGINGALLNSRVYVYTQSSSSHFTYGDTGSDGVVSFYLAPGTYKVKTVESNYIWKTNLVVTSGNDTDTTAVFGRLNVHSRDFDGNPLNSRVYVYTQSSSSHFTYGDTGSDGVVSFYLAPGTYKVKIIESTDVWYCGIVVTAGQATNVGDYINHNPVINSITANPARIDPGGSTTISVSVSDVDGDPLSYSYSATVGTVVGSGSTALYTAPTTSDTYRIDVVVSDGNGGTAQGSIFVSDRYGNLVVNSKGVDGEPLNSRVYVYKQSSNSHFTYGDTGNDGTITFSLLEDIYKIKVVESNEIWVGNILVVYGSTGIIIGDGIDNTAPVIDSYSPTQTSLITNEGETITFTANASDPDGMYPQYRWYLDGVFQSALDTWTFYASYTDSGNRTVTLEVTDGQYSVYQKWDVSVNNVNQNPIITNLYVTDTTLLPLNSTDIRVTAVDFDGDELSYSWSSTGGAFSSISGGNTIWTAPILGGTYIITVNVSDGNGGSDSASLIIVVHEVEYTYLGEITEKLSNNPDSIIDHEVTVHCLVHSKFQMPGGIDVLYNFIDFVSNVPGANWLSYVVDTLGWQKETATFYIIYGDLPEESTYFEQGYLPANIIASFPTPPPQDIEVGSVIKMVGVVKEGGALKYYIDPISWEYDPPNVHYKSTVQINSEINQMGGQRASTFGFVKERKKVGDTNVLSLKENVWCTYPGQNPPDIGALVFVNGTVTEENLQVLGLSHPYILADTVEIRIGTDSPITGPEVAISSYNLASASCPVDLHAYDSLGRHVGVVYDNENTTEIQIPNSLYSGSSSNQEFILILEPDEETAYNIKALDEGKLNFTIDQATSNKTTSVGYQNISITENTTATVNINQTSADYNMSMDYDGDDIIDDIIEPDYVETNYAPITAFTYTPAEPFINQPITFNASNSTDDGYIASHEWSFGDGNTTTTPDPVITHTYVSPDVYTVTLTVTDNGGLTDTISRNVAVRGIRGDLNHDNQINPADAAIALRIAVGSSASCDPTTLTAADVSGDGQVTSLDALMILNAAAGEISL